LILLENNSLSFWRNSADEDLRRDHVYGTRDCRPMWFNQV
jgi:hypothetical protein